MRVFRGLVLTAFTLLFVVIFSVIAIALLALDDQPLLAFDNSIAADTVSTAKLDQKQPEASKKAAFWEEDSDGLIHIPDKELSLLLQQQLQRSDLGSAIKLVFFRGHANGQMSLLMPIEFSRKFLNVRFTAKQSKAPQHLELDTLQLGNIQVPPSLISYALPYLIETCQRDRRCRSAMDAYRNVETLELGTGVLKLRYRLGADTLSQIGGLNVDQLPLPPYLSALSSLAYDHGNKRIPLHVALQAVLQVSASRSFDNNPMTENTAAILALALQSSDARFQKLILAEQKTDLNLIELQVSVHQRRDLAQHFIGSAALYLIGGTEFSDYVGIYKEFLDLSQGKKFGAGDLVANRAGVRFARLATSSAKQAQALQSKMLAEQDTTAYLLNKLQIRELERQYNVRTTEEINEIVTVIDNALAELPLLH
ncbi:MAG: hypothetical protein AB8B48_07250 [Pseudomonadales bacterium]